MARTWRARTPGLAAVQLILIGEAVYTTITTVQQMASTPTAGMAAPGALLIALLTGLAVTALLIIKLGALSSGARVFVVLLYLASIPLSVVFIVHGRAVPTAVVDLALALFVIYVLVLDRMTVLAFREAREWTRATGVARNALAPAWIQNLALPKAVRAANTPKAADVAANRMGTMTLRQRWPFIWVGVPLVCIALLVVIGSLAPTPHMANQPDRATVIVVGIAFASLFVLGGLPAVIDGLVGRTVRTEGIPSAPSEPQGHVTSRRRVVLVDRVPVAVPGNAFPSLVSATTKVRVYRSSVLGRFLSWERASND